MNALIKYGCIIFFLSLSTVFANFNLAWEKTYDLDAQNNSGCCAIATQAGGYAFVGTMTQSNTIVLLLTDNLGRTRWQQTLSLSTFDWASQIIQTQDLGFVLVGSTRTCGFLVKFDNSSNLEWLKTYPATGANKYSAFSSVIELANGDLVVCGENYGSSQNALLMRVNFQGEQIWSRQYEDETLNARKILLLSDGFAILAARADSDPDNSSTCLLKTNFDGEIIWQQNNLHAGIFYPQDIIQTRDKGFALIGNSYVADSTLVETRAGILLKTDENGYAEWTESFNYETSTLLASILELDENHYLITGAAYEAPFKYSRFDLIEVERSEKSKHIRSSILGDGMGSSIFISKAGAVMVAGTRYASQENSNKMVLMELSGFTTQVEAQTAALPVACGLLQNYPNPFNPTTTICYDLAKDCQVHISICNSRGQIVETLKNEFESQGSHSVVWDAASHPAGVYFYRLLADGESFIKKMTLVK